VERRQYQERPDRFEYVPTPMALDLVPTILALVAWGDRWTGLAGPPVLFSHQPCGHDTVATVVCSECSEPLVHADIGPHPGPGLPADYPWPG
jgi:hypothetical protein